MPGQKLANGDITRAFEFLHEGLKFSFKIRSMFELLALQTESRTGSIVESQVELFEPAQSGCGYTVDEFGAEFYRLTVIQSRVDPASHPVACLNNYDF